MPSVPFNVEENNSIFKRHMNCGFNRLTISIMIIIALSVLGAIAAAIVVLVNKGDSPPVGGFPPEAYSPPPPVPAPHLPYNPPPPVSAPPPPVSAPPPPVSAPPPLVPAPPPPVSAPPPLVPALPRQSPPPPQTYCSDTTLYNLDTLCVKIPETSCPDGNRHASDRGCCKYISVQSGRCTCSTRFVNPVCIDQSDLDVYKCVDYMGRNVICTSSVMKYSRYCVQNNEDTVNTLCRETFYEVDCNKFYDTDPRPFYDYNACCRYYSVQNDNSLCPQFEISDICQKSRLYNYTARTKNCPI